MFDGLRCPIHSAQRHAQIALGFGEIRIKPERHRLMVWNRVVQPAEPGRHRKAELPVDRCQRRIELRRLLQRDPAPPPPAPPGRPRPN